MQLPKSQKGLKRYSKEVICLFPFLAIGQNCACLVLNLKKAELYLVSFFVTEIFYRRARISGSGWSFHKGILIVYFYVYTVSALNLYKALYYSLLVPAEFLSAVSQLHATDRRPQQHDWVKENKKTQKKVKCSIRRFDPKLSDLGDSSKFVNF